MLKLVLAVSPALYRDGLRDMLESESDIEITREVSDYAGILSIPDDENLDLVFLDSNLSGLNMMEYLSILKEKKFPPKILLLLNSLDEATVINALCLGIKGCLDIQSSKAHFIQAIRAINNQEIWADVGLISKALNKLLHAKKFSLDDLKHRLTKKEEIIARLILQGFSNKDIGKELFISEKTVKTHVGHIFKKLGIKSRFQLTANYLGKELFKSES